MVLKAPPIFIRGVGNINPLLDELTKNQYLINNIREGRVRVKSKMLRSTYKLRTFSRETRDHRKQVTGKRSVLLKRSSDVSTHRLARMKQLTSFKCTTISYCPGQVRQMCRRTFHDGLHQEGERDSQSKRVKCINKKKGRAARKQLLQKLFPNREFVPDQE